MKKLEEMKYEFKYKIAEFILNILDKLIKTTPTVYTCMSCNKEYDEPQECSCGSKRFIYDSRKYKIEDGEVTCGCGKGHLESDTHYDCDDGFGEEFVCSRCKNIISIYEYMEEEDYNFDADEMLRYLSQLDDEYLEDIDLEKLHRDGFTKILRISEVE